MGGEEAIRNEKELLKTFIKCKTYSSKLKATDESKDDVNALLQTIHTLAKKYIIIPTKQYNCADYVRRAQIVLNAIDVTEKISNGLVGDEYKHKINLSDGGEPSPDYGERKIPGMLRQEMNKRGFDPTLENRVTSQQMLGCLHKISGTILPGHKVNNACSPTAVDNMLKIIEKALADRGGLEQLQHLPL